MRKIVESGYETGDYAGKFRRNNQPNKMEENFLKKLIDILPKNPSVLDFGCGTGIPFDKYLAEHSCEITGIDISKKHIDQAKKNIPRAEFIKGDFSRINVQKTFDAIISLYAIFHIPREEHKDLFKKMAEILNKNGAILVTLGTTNEKCIEAKDWCDAKMAWSTYDPEMYKKMLNEAGFKIVNAMFEGKPGDEEHHFWVLAKKK